MQVRKGTGSMGSGELAGRREGMTSRSITLRWQEASETAELQAEKGSSNLQNLALPPTRVPML